MSSDDTLAAAGVVDGGTSFSCRGHPLPSAPYCVLTFVRQRNVMSAAIACLTVHNLKPPLTWLAGRCQMLSECPRYSLSTRMQAKEQD